jgi:hypothetical protein
MHTRENMLGRSMNKWLCLLGTTISCKGRDAMHTRGEMLRRSINEWLCLLADEFCAYVEHQNS